LSLLHLDILSFSLSLLNIKSSPTMSPSQREAVFQAIIVEDGNRNENESTVRQAKSAKLNEGTFGRFKTSSVLLGVIVGFLNVSILGANFLLGTSSLQRYALKTKRDIFVFSVLWSIFTSAVAISILRFIRTSITVTFHATSKKSEEVLEEMIHQMETRFVIGALVGMCMSWTITVFLLGVNTAVIWGLIVLDIVVFLVCLCSTSNCFAKSHRESSRREGLSEPLLVV